MTLPFTIDELDAAIAEGLVTARPHEVYPYTIYNYSEECQFRKQWNKVTLNCRGLILHNESYRLVARPWKKFFNLGEVNLPVQFTDPVEVMDKMDGSLGILFETPDGSYDISTRGSFHSEQAEHATKVWHERYADLNEYVKASGMTFLFEIVYKANRIVLDYGDMDDLVLLGAVDIRDGYYHGPREAAAYIGWTGPQTKVFDHKTISDALRDTARVNAEGFVIRAHNFLVKLKQPDYVEIHRLRFNMTPKRIWEALSEGKSLEQIVAPLPDEFQDVILEIGAGIEEDYLALQMEIAEEWEHVKEILDRKTFAQAVEKSRHRSAMFSLFDDKSYEKYLWSKVKPVKE